MDKKKHGQYKKDSTALDMAYLHKKGLEERSHKIKKRHRHTDGQTK